MKSENNSYQNIVINYENFDYKTYLKLNADVNVSSNNIKKNTWNHWIYNGMNEERPTSFINNTKTHNGRFGNIF
jgi:hypothetical protein